MRVGLLGPSALQTNEELWARPTVLTPVPSPANHSASPIAVGSRRVRLSETYTYVSTPWAVSRATPEKVARTCGTPWSVFQAG